MKKFAFILLIIISTFNLKANFYSFTDSTFKEDSVFVSRDIYFEFATYTLHKDSNLNSYDILDSIVKFLKINKSIAIEVSWHRDERGSNRCCQNLSQRRAQTIKDYLTEHGINPVRITAKGYGDTKPIIKNAKTEEEHYINRRAEFKILRKE